jgi:hypothetical protein
MDKMYRGVEGTKTFAIHDAQGAAIDDGVLTIVGMYDAYGASIPGLENIAVPATGENGIYVWDIDPQVFHQDIPIGVTRIELSLTRSGRTTYEKKFVEIADPIVATT